MDYIVNFSYKNNLVKFKIFKNLSIIITLFTKIYKKRAFEIQLN